MTFIEKQQEEAREKLPMMNCNHTMYSVFTLLPEDLDSLISQVVQNTLRHILIYEQWVSFSEHDKGMAVPSETVQSLLKEITNTTKEE